ncbi:hypothetical protein [Stenotrophomonas sp.]|uniref:bestrophin-like domain n=1 Tax=Stenotrophomonas sp. TaxID=69392 RepID=UPI0028AF9702|nr:hypothetical protein [Stenotrophomonas sp.]
MPIVSDSYPYLPVWLLSIMLFAALLLAREAGAWFGRRRVTKPVPGDEGFARTTVLGLLALLIGFTFSIALQRYDSRRALVVDEANAIGTTWLRVSLLEEHDRPQAKAVLLEYTMSRLDFGEAHSSRDELARHRASVRAQSRLWETLINATASFKDTPRAGLILASTNDAIDLAEARLASRQAHIPPRILRMLVLFSVLSAGLVGYERPSERRTSAMVLGLFTLAAALVVDLDRPTTGITNVPQIPMVNLFDSMQRDQ